MAKQQRRAGARAATAAAPQAKSRSASRPVARATAAGVRPPSRRASRAAQSPAAPTTRPTFADALAAYERGVAALHRRDYRTASGLLRGVIERYPEEKELHERVRLYLNVCERQLVPEREAPLTVQERIYASTLSLNEGAYDRAIANLRMVRDEDPDNDHALYMLAVAHALRGEPVEAISHLARAIALNPENRIAARQDPDLDSLRQDDLFRTVLDASGPGQPSRPVRPRPSR